MVFDYNQADGIQGSAFFARNLGRGAALNAYLFQVDPQTVDADFISLGGRMPETEVRPATDVSNLLNPEVTARVTDRIPLFILTQAAIGSDWTLIQYQPRRPK